MALLRTREKFGPEEDSSIESHKALRNLGISLWLYIIEVLRVQVVGGAFCP